MAPSAEREIIRASAAMSLARLFTKWGKSDEARTVLAKSTAGSPRDSTPPT
jgi:hypothetical protein